MIASPVSPAIFLFVLTGERCIVRRLAKPVIVVVVDVVVVVVVVVAVVVVAAAVVVVLFHLSQNAQHLKLNAVRCGSICLLCII